MPARVVLSLALAAPAWADAVTDAADAAARAFAARDLAALKSLAEKDDPDPWLVADELCFRGAFDVAGAFAKAAPRRATEELPAYVAASRGRASDANAREALLVANTALAAGKPEEALRALAPVPVEHGDVVSLRILAARGQALRSLNRLEESAQAFLAGARGALDAGWVGGAVSMLDEAGQSHYRRSDFRGALEVWTDCLRAARDLGDRHGEARTLGKMGNAHRNVGSYAQALELLESARKLQEDLGDRPGRASTLANIGRVHASLGLHALALEHLDRGLRLMEDLGDRFGAARALADIGVVHQQVGSYPRALEYLERALEIEEELGDRVGAAKALGNIGTVHQAVGSYARAIEYHERARTLMQELGDRDGVARSLANIGEVHRRLGSHARALEHLERALELQDDLGDRAAMVMTLTRIANVHRDLGSHVRALEYHERARALAKDLGALELEVRNLWGVATVSLKLGDSGEAARCAREAVEKLPLLEGRLSEDLGASARERWNPLLDTGVLAALRLDDPAEACFFLESDRAAGLLEALGGREALRAATIPLELAAEERETRASLEAARARQDRANRAGDRVVILAAREEVERARTSVLDAIAAVQRAAKARADVAYPKARSLAEIRNRLRDGEALVLYAMLPADSAALVATRDEARLVRLGPAKRIEDLCASLEAAGPAALREAITKPLGLPAGVRRILVSPDGVLSYVPFTMLVPDREIAYVPSGTTYDVLCDEGDLRGDGVLAIGDPDYGAAPDSRVRGAQLVPLPATRAEAKAIGEVVLLGEDATPARFMLEIASRPRWRAVHIACHGLVDPERPLLSSLALTGGDLATLDVYRSAVPADLVVLSACETAKGKVYRSEGVVGFVRAFMFAGAPRVIVSLWKVDDDATRALMERFHERWKGGAGAARALKEAQEHVAAQEKWSHPKYWAAWQLWGLPE